MEECLVVSNHKGSSSKKGTIKRQKAHLTQKQIEGLQQDGQRKPKQMWDPDSKMLLLSYFFGGTWTLRCL